MKCVRILTMCMRVCGACMDEFRSECGHTGGLDPNAGTPDVPNIYQESSRELPCDLRILLVMRLIFLFSYTMSVLCVCHNNSSSYGFLHSLHLQCLMGLGRPLRDSKVSGGG